jgi:hypothetical protein
MRVYTPRGTWKRVFDVSVEDAITERPLDELKLREWDRMSTCYIQSKENQTFQLRMQLSEELPIDCAYGVDVYMDGKLVIRPVLGKIAESLVRTDISVQTINAPGDYVIPLRFGETKTHSEHGIRNRRLLDNLGRISVCIYHINITGQGCPTPREFSDAVYDAELVHPLKNHSAK